MENIEVKKRTSSQKIVAKKKKQKIYFDFLNFENNKALSIFYFLIFIAILVFSFFVFSNNSYYVFIKRPKVLESAVVLSVIFSLICILTYVYMIADLFEKFKDKKAQNIAQQNDKITQKNIKSNDDVKGIKKAENKNNIKKSTKNWQKTGIFNRYFAIFLLSLILEIAFLLKFLWLCCFVSFLIFFLFVSVFFRSKKKHLRVFSLLLILLSICNLLSFYFLYLLN